MTLRARLLATVSLAALVAAMPAPIRTPAELVVGR